MIYAYQHLRLNTTTRARIQLINNIIEEYTAQGFQLTLRQLYYQLVSRDVIANKQAEYARLSTLLVKARMGGYIDWDAIVDRVRRPYLPYHAENPKAAVADLVAQYRVDRMQGQNVYIEVWCEKDAISEILKRVTSEFGVRLMVNRGYSSCTAMHDAYQRMLVARQGRDITDCILFYLGDHDPSGLDMIRDIRDRVGAFEDGADSVNLTVKHLALTTAQVKKYNPPPNPAKLDDPRATNYVAEHGYTSWEVDALSPSILINSVRRAIIAEIDADKFEAAIKQEGIDKQSLLDIKLRG